MKKQDVELDLKIIVKSTEKVKERKRLWFGRVEFVRSRGYGD
jgi:hypothetical protein